MISQVRKRHQSGRVTFFPSLVFQEFISNTLPKPSLETRDANIDATLPTCLPRSHVARYHCALNQASLSFKLYNFC